MRRFESGPRLQVWSGPAGYRAAKPRCRDGRLCASALGAIRELRGWCSSGDGEAGGGLEAAGGADAERIAVWVQCVEEVGLACSREACREVGLHSAAEDFVGVEREGGGGEGFSGLVGELDLAGVGVVGDDPEGNVFYVDLGAEVADPDDEHALVDQEADASQKRPMQARVRDQLAFVDERSVAPQQQSAVPKRGRARQRVSGRVEPSVASSSTPRQS